MTKRCYGVNQVQAQANKKLGGNTPYRDMMEKRVWFETHVEYRQAERSFY